MGSVFLFISPLSLNDVSKIVARERGGGPCPRAIMLYSVAVPMCLLCLGECRGAWLSEDREASVNNLLQHKFPIPSLSDINIHVLWVLCVDCVYVVWMHVVSNNNQYSNYLQSKYHNPNPTSLYQYIHFHVAYRRGTFSLSIYSFLVFVASSSNSSSPGLWKLIECVAFCQPTVVPITSSARFGLKLVFALRLGTCLDCLCVWSHQCLFAWR